MTGSMTPVLVLAESCLDIIGRERMKNNYNKGVVEGERERGERRRESDTRCEKAWECEGI